MNSLDTLQSSIITWADKANAKLSKPEQEMLYKKCISEEYKEFISAETDAEEYSEIMDLLWVIFIYCNIKKYSVPLGLSSLLSANEVKLINPIYNEYGKLLKGSKYVRPDWKKILEESKMEI